MSLPNPPPQYDSGWMFLLWRKVTEVGGTAWASISKVGSRLTDIESRQHGDLQDLNSGEYSHLTSDQVNQLTGGGSTSLHSHYNEAGAVSPASDRAYSARH